MTKEEKTNQRIEQKLRRLPIDKLRNIKMFGDLPSIKSTQLSTAIGATENALGGYVSSLLRTSVDGEPLIVARGRDGDDLILTVNKNLISQDGLRKIMERIGV